MPTRHLSAWFPLLLSCLLAACATEQVEYVDTEGNVLAVDAAGQPVRPANTRRALAPARAQAPNPTRVAPRAVPPAPTRGATRFGAPPASPAGLLGAPPAGAPAPIEAPSRVPVRMHAPRASAPAKPTPASASGLGAPPAGTPKPIRR